MFKFFLSLFFVVLLAGCATPYGVHSVLEEGSYAQAYAMTVNHEQYYQDRKKVVDYILRETGGSKKDVYFRAVHSLVVSQSQKDSRFFLATLKHINAAPSDGLLSQAQANSLRDDLQKLLEETSLTNPVLLQSNELLSAFGLAGDKIAMADRSLQRLERGSDVDLKNIFPIYFEYKNNGDGARVKKAIAVMQKIVEKDLNSFGSRAIGYSSLSVYLEYIALTGDSTFDAKIQDLLARAFLSRKELLEIEKFYPEFAKKQMKSRLVRVDIKTNGDEFLAVEIANQLNEINEWVVLDEDSARKINLVRLRLNEQRMQPMSNTEIISDPDFGVLLMIPKNASVLVDFNVSEYSMQWSFVAQDSRTKKSKTISGTRRFKKIECRNMRYQNVFGGVGALHSFPNARVQRLCEEGLAVDFDKARSDVIREFAHEINAVFLTAQ